jgi:hypothetical protein
VSKPTMPSTVSPLDRAFPLAGRNVAAWKTKKEEAPAKVDRPGPPNQRGDCRETTTANLR